MPAFVADDELWEEAKKIVRKEYGLSEEDGEKFWKLVTGVYKQAGGKMKKKKAKKSIKLVIDLSKSANDLKRYTLLRWNGEYGEDALFVVRDNVTKLQAIFSPYAVEFTDWTNEDLVNQNPMKNWEDFGNESVDDLEDVVI